MIERLTSAAAVVTLMTGAAFAATENGTITLVNPARDAVALAGGKTFILGEGTEAKSRTVGQKVIVTDEAQAGKFVATKIVVANRFRRFVWSASPSASGGRWERLCCGRRR